MRHVFAITIMLMLLPMAVGNAETWGDAPLVAPVPDVVTVPVEVTVVPAGDAGLKAAAADVAGRERLTVWQRRSMGITIPNIMRTMIAMHRAGELEGKDSGLVAASVGERLVTDNPKAFADPKLDWDAVMEWIEIIVRIILSIMVFL